MLKLIDQYRQAGLQPPSVTECQQSAAKHQKSVRSLIALAASDGELVELNAELFLHAATEAQLRTTLRQAFHERSSMTVSEIRELLKTSRKYAVPICEYLDRIGFTRREGDQRRLSSTAEQATV
jgi:selenocysteine-specific elongation factor